MFFPLPNERDGRIFYAVPHALEHILYPLLIPCPPNGDKARTYDAVFTNGRNERRHEVLNNALESSLSLSLSDLGGVQRTQVRRNRSRRPSLKI